MSADKPLGKTGNAQLIRQGHTEQGSFGQSTKLKAKGDRSSRDLNPK